MRSRRRNPMVIASWRILMSGRPSRGLPETPGAADRRAIALAGTPGAMIEHLRLLVEVNARV